MATQPLIIADRLGSGGISIQIVDGLPRALGHLVPFARGHAGANVFGVVARPQPSRQLLRRYATDHEPSSFWEAKKGALTHQIAKPIESGGIDRSTVKSTAGICLRP